MTKINTEDISKRLYKVLDQLETVMQDIGTLSDEMMLEHLIENGEITPATNNDFINRKD